MNNRERLPGDAPLPPAPYRINQYPTPSVCRITSQTSYPTPNTSYPTQHSFQNAGKKVSFLDELFQ